MFRKTAAVSVAALFLTAPSLAQQAVNGPSKEKSEIDRIVVEGSRLNQTAAEIGSSVSIITAADIDALGYDFALDALAAAPGVTVNANGAFGGSATVRIRGAASEQTLVLVDGVVVNDPSTPGGGFDFARFDTENIERIEVLKGPHSTLWGGDAIGGVVSIVTKRPDEGLGGTAFAEYGSFNTIRGGASVEVGGDVGDLRIAAVGVASDGISKADADNGNAEEDGYEAVTLSAKGGLNLGGTARLSADILWTDASADFDSFSGGAQGNVADGDEVSETEEVTANVSLTAPLFNGRLENLVLVGYTDITRDNFANGAPSFGAAGDRIAFRYQGTLTIDDKNTLAFGVEREESSANGDDTSINGFFALYEVKPTDALTVTGGVRVDDHERFDSQTTGRVAVAYNPTESITVRASWGQGFKAPTIFQTTFFCCGATAPNADLRPESSNAFDVGVDWRSGDGRMEAGVAYFNQNTDDLIAFFFDVGGYENIAEVRSQGVELYGAIALADWLTVSAGYAYIDATDGGGARLIQVPEHSGDVTVSVDPDGPFSGSISLRYNGEEENIDGTTLDNWARVDLAAQYRVSDRVQIFGRVENLFDKSYQQILGYGTPGLSGSIGLRLRY